MLTTRPGTKEIKMNSKYDPNMKNEEISHHKYISIQKQKKYPSDAEETFHLSQHHNFDDEMTSFERKGVKFLFKKKS